jgi:hypothetical protein
MSGFLLFVSTGLDPMAHAAPTIRMDCRIKSGNDDVWSSVILRCEQAKLASLEG